MSFIAGSELVDVWSSVRSELQSVFGEAVVNNWIAPLVPEKLEEDTLYLSAPNAFFAIGY